MEHMQEKIDYLKKFAEVEFSSQEIRTQGLFPWARNDRTIVKLIERDTTSGENILRARIEGEGRQRRYFIKGRQIIKYIEKYGPALMVRVPKPKRHEHKKAEAKGSKKEGR